MSNDTVSQVSVPAVDVFDFLNDPEALAALHAAYSKASEEKQEEKSGKGKTPRAPKAPKAPKLAAEKPEKDPDEIVVLVPAPGETYKALGSSGILASNPPALVKLGIALSSACFLGAMNAAGKREVTDEVTGQIKTVFDPSAFRADAQEAVSSFNGWTSEALGTQIDRATLHARFLSVPQGKLAMPHRSPEKHSAKASVAGFVAGLPNTTRKVLADLAARERCAAAEMIDMGKLVSYRDNGQVVEYESALTRYAREEPGIAGVLRAHPEYLGAMYDIAAGRLAEVRADMGELADEASILRAGEIIARRGMPTFEESISLLGQTPRAN